MPPITSVFMLFLNAGTNQKRKSASADSSVSVNPETPISANPLSSVAGKFRNRISGTAALLMSAFLVSPAYAAGSSMPWEAPLQSILESIEGPVAKIIAVIIIIVTGLTLAFGDAGGGFRKLVQIVFGLSIVFAASSFFLSFFSFGGGALV